MIGLLWALACSPAADPEVEACLAALRPGEPFALSESATGAQIHAELAFGRSALWATWSEARDGSFHTRAARLGCDGAAVVPAFDVSPGGFDHLDPTLLADADGAVFAWQSNDPSQSSNLDIWLASVDGEGAPVAPASRYEGRRAGALVTGNAWMPALGGSPSAPVLAGSWGHPDAPAFQAFAQRLGPDLVATDDAIDLALAPERTQVFPSVAVDSAGVVWAAWDDSADDQAVRWASWGEGAPAVVDATPGATPSVAAGPLGAFVVAATEGGLSVFQGSGAPFATLGGANAVAPALAVTDTHLAVAWLEPQSGLSHALHLAWLDAEGAVVSTSTLVPERVPPYPLRLSALPGDAVALAWQQGQSPDFEALGLIATP